jgi:ABC-2 type transport system ATP-binding protein
VPQRKGTKQYNVNDKPLLVNKLYGFASQRPSFYEKLTVRENLAYFGSMYGLSPQAVKKNSDILLRLLELQTCQHVLAENLSGGMKRRLDIACAMIHNPSILILDEPTADLDPVLRNQIWEIIKRINLRGTTIILSSHHLNELDTLCNRIAILKSGNLVDLDTPDKLKLKYNREQEIMIESYPGNYEKLTDDIKKHNVTNIDQEGTYLTIRTEEPEKLITDVLVIMKKHRETLIDIKLNKPNLDDVYTRIYGEKE